MGLPYMPISWGGQCMAYMAVPWSVWVMYNKSRVPNLDTTNGTMTHHFAWGDCGYIYIYLDLPTVTNFCLFIHKISQGQHMMPPKNTSKPPFRSESLGKPTSGRPFNSQGRTTQQGTLQNPSNNLGFGSLE